MAGYYKWPMQELDEEMDLEFIKCWGILPAQSMPTRKPIIPWHHARFCSHGNHWASDQLAIPLSWGLHFVTTDGHLYFGTTPTNEEERKKREPIFRERMRPWIEDFEGEWRGKLAAELKGWLEHFKMMDLEKLSDFELLKTFEDWLRIAERGEEIHFLGMMAGCIIYKLFEDMSRELLGIDSNDAQFKRLMTGFEHKTDEVAQGLWRLGDRAKELGLEPLFQATPDDEKLLSALEESDAGRKWLQELHQFLNDYGWQTEPVHDFSAPTWIEKPVLTLPLIKKGMVKGGTFVLEQERERLVKEREEAEGDVLSRISIDKREWFEKLMRAAPWAGRYNEEHIYYLDGGKYAPGRHILMEVGRRFARAGVVDDPDDVFLLHPEEIIRSLILMEKLPLRKTTRIRKQQWEEWSKPEAMSKMLAEKFFIGDVKWLGERMAEDPMLPVVVGLPVVKPELKADLYAAASAPGVAEGTARVLFSEQQIAEIQPGEILVTPSTTPIWNPAFGIIKAVVTDQGGHLAHAVIVAREYGIPCVAGTQEATTKIRTGMRVRVDGDMGAVYILEG